MILLLAVGIGWMLGKLAGGQARRLADPGFRGLALPIIAVALQALTGPAAQIIPGDPQRWYPYVVIVSYGANVLFALRNLSPLYGSLPVLLGTLGNFIVIAANRWHMPVAPSAAALPQILAPAQRLGYALADETTRLLWLGDIMAVPVPLIGGYLSIGDLLLCLGVGALIRWRMVTPGPESK
jgi:hypothetical protein